MNVNLISVTKPIITSVDGKEFSSEELIVYIARVSNPSNQMNTSTSGKLLKYLIDHKHWSPFEHVSMTVQIVTSRAIAQQIIRHRSFVFQEFSQRYAEVTEFEPVQLRKQAEKNRQSSTENADDLIVNFKNYPVKAIECIEHHIKQSEEIYKALIHHGVAKECARMVLPLTTQTTIYMTGSCRSWIHYLQQRLDEHTQLEHRQVAVGIADIFEQLFPNIYQEVFA